MPELGYAGAARPGLADAMRDRTRALHVQAERSGIIGKSCAGARAETDMSSIFAISCPLTSNSKQASSSSVTCRHWQALREARSIGRRHSARIWRRWAARTGGHPIPFFPLLPGMPTRLRSPPGETAQGCWLTLTRGILAISMAERYWGAYWPARWHSSRARAPFTRFHALAISISSSRNTVKPSMQQAAPSIPSMPCLARPSRHFATTLRFRARY